MPKTAVTEPLDPGWVKSPYNLPTPGTIADYRKGLYHVHETATRWRVHLDRYDPADHPLLHLVDDAPLVFMIADAFYSLVKRTEQLKTSDLWAILEEQNRVWQKMVLLGTLLVFIGVLMSMHPTFIFRQFILDITPVVLMGVSLIILWKGVRLHPFQIEDDGMILIGLGGLAVAILSILLPPVWFGWTLASILAFWQFFTAYVSLRRVASSAEETPEGHYKRLAIGVSSLLLAIALFVVPIGVAILLVYVTAALTLLFGISEITNGLRLWRRMKRIRSSRTSSMLP